MTASGCFGEAAARRREELARHWLTPHEVSALALGIGPDASASLALSGNRVDCSESGLPTRGTTDTRLTSSRPEVYFDPRLLNF